MVSDSAIESPAKSIEHYATIRFILPGGKACPEHRIPIASQADACLRLVGNLALSGYHSFIRYERCPCNNLM